MITWEEARILITDHLISEWADLHDLFLEGQEEPDLTTRTNPFLSLELEPTRVQQIGMLGGNPPLRAYGVASLNFTVPKMTGAKVRLEGLDRLIDIFASRTVGEVTFQDVSVLPAVLGKDWRAQPILVNFYFEQNTGA